MKSGGIFAKGVFQSPNDAVLDMSQTVKLRVPSRDVAARCFLPLARGGALAGLAALLAACEPAKAPTPPPPAVQVLAVQPQDVPVMETWVATVTADVNADIRAQVSGYLQSQNYRNGAYVKAGDVLFQIDPRPFQALLDQANGSLAQAQAQLTASEQNYKRSADLYSKKVISQQQYDDQTQQYQGALAAYKAAQASVEQAQLNLVFTRITAPVDGFASIAAAQVGDLVGPSSGSLATVVKTDPIKVQFMVPEQDYVHFIAQFFNDPSKSPVGTNKAIDMPLALTLAGGVAYPLKGSITSINNVVGTYTGSISMEGEFPNPGRLLRPGQFGLVTATTHKDKGAYLVPQRAIINLQGLTQIALVGEGNKVNIVNVTLGPTLGSDQVVTAGLNPGNQVIVEGVQKVRQGAVVNPSPYVETGPEKASAELASPPASTPDASTPDASPTAKP